MSIGSFSQDPLFKAFSSSVNKSISDEGFADLSKDNSAINIGSNSVPGDHSFPTGSRLLAYMQPTQLSRKSSRSSTESKINLISSPPTPSHMKSVMSPYANVFQPSSSKSNANISGYNVEGNAPTLEQDFSDILSFAEYDYHRQQQLNFGPNNGVLSQGFVPGNLPTPPNSLGSLPMGDAIGFRRNLAKSPAALHSSAVQSNIAVESIGGTTYFFNTPPLDNQAHAQELQCQREQIDGNLLPKVIVPEFYMYNGPLSNVANFRPRDGMGFASFFAPDEFKSEIVNRQVLCMAEADPSMIAEVPQEVDNYHHLVPLEPLPGILMQNSGVVSTVYKANSTKTGLAFCLRRIHNYRLTNMRCLSVIDAWKKLQHSNIVQIREVFTTKAFGDSSVIFVYDYWPAAETIKSKHFGRVPVAANGFGAPSAGNDFETNKLGQAHMISQKIGPAGTSRNNRETLSGTGILLPEAFIWCYIIQLSSALRQIHSLGLSARTIDPSKLLSVGKSRLMVNCCGLFDVLAFDEMQQPALIQRCQQEDLANFGRLVLALACNNPMAAMQREQWQSAIEFISRHYSPDLKNLIIYLTAPQRIRNVNDIMPMIGARFYSQLETAQNRIDVLENELAKEISNGRLFRLLCKLGAINERPEFAMDPQWSETGDRFLLKLFRDYLFHQITEDGRPWLDLSHVVQCLNKLDAGISEKIMLSSRDEQNVLIVSYAELHRCLDQAFGELNRSSQSVETVSSVGPALLDQGCYFTPTNS